MEGYLFGMLIFFVVMAGACVAMFARDVARLGSVRRVLDSSFLSFSLVYAMMSVMGALLCTAGLLSEQEGSWRFIPLVLINVLIQPLCCFAVAMGGFKVIMALTGRVTLGFRIVSREEVEEAEGPPISYRMACIIVMAHGTVGLLIFGSIGLACLLPLL
jgi:hypothetical protein